MTKHDKEMLLDSFLDTSGHICTGSESCPASFVSETHPSKTAPVCNYTENLILWKKYYII